MWQEQCWNCSFQICLFVSATVDKYETSLIVTTQKNPKTVTTEAGDQKNGNVDQLLLIASLITLRLLQLEEGNLGSASSSRPTVVSENTQWGVDLTPPTPSGVTRLRVPDLGSTACFKTPRLPRPASGPRTRGTTQSEKPLGLPLGPKLLICRVVLQTPA